MDDWSSFRTTTSEQQRLRAALSSFCESQDLPEEQRAAYTAYLRKRIRPAVEMLIREDDFSKLERILQTGWLSDADRKRFLNLAADQQKWQAFRILLNRSSQDPMQENTESRKTEAAFQKEKPTKEKEALALRLFEEARKNLCWLYPELGEAILFFQHQPSDRTKAITSDGHTIYFNSDFVLCMCAENSSFLKEGYQHLLLECIRRIWERNTGSRKKKNSPGFWLMTEKENSLRFHGWCREKNRNLSSLFNQSGNVLPASWRKTTAPAACGEARTVVEKKKPCPGSKKECTITAAS